MAITKLDVMDTFETVCACVGYLDKEGNEIDYMPASIRKLGEVTAKIQEFPGWMTDTTKCSQVFFTNYNDIIKKSSQLKKKSFEIIQVLKSFFENLIPTL